MHTKESFEMFNPGEDWTKKLGQSGGPESNPESTTSTTNLTQDDIEKAIEKVFSSKEDIIPRWIDREEFNKAIGRSLDTEGQQAKKKGQVPLQQSKRFTKKVRNNKPTNFTPKKKKRK